MKTKIQLKKWVLVVLKVLLIIDLFIMICEANTLKIMIIKTFITILISFPIIYLLINYGGVENGKK